MNGIPIQPTDDVMSIGHDTSGVGLLNLHRMDTIIIFK